MTDRKLQRIELDKKKETRTKEISNMIDEGGLGAYKYYDYPNNSKPQKPTKSEENLRMLDEGGMGTNNRTHYQEETIANYKD